MNQPTYRDAVRAQGKQVLLPNFTAIETARLHEMGAHWCCWRLEDRPGAKPGAKMGKVPFDGYRRIDTQQPTQWITYSQAKEFYLSGEFDGIGFLPTHDDLIVALDADGVIGPEGTGCDTASEIIERLEHLGCYLELSPSGAGLRGFILGVNRGKPKVTVGGHSVECYPAEKLQYVTVSGATWNKAKPIAVPDGQAKLDAFLTWSGQLGGDVGGDVAQGASVGAVADDGEVDGWVKRADSEVERLLLGSLNPQGAYTRLMAGNIGGHDGQSEARFALLTQLAYITRDDVQIERIIRRSKLDATKFDEKRSGSRNFLHYDIKRALKAKTRNYDLDIVEKKQKAEKQAGEVTAFKAKAAERLHGGAVDLLTADGKLKAGMHTLSELLIRDRRLIGNLWFDEFAGMPKKSISFAEAFNDRCAPKTAGQLEDDDLLAVTAWARTQWGLVAEERSIVMGAVRRWARATSINPVTDKLQGFGDAYDGVERLSSLMTNYFGAKPKDEDEAYYLEQVGMRFMIGVVARAFVPGTQQDQLLVLQSTDGGEGKTAAVRILGRAIDPSAYLEGFAPAESADCYMLMRGKALAELGELVGFNRHEAEWIKNFLSREQDAYRDPYGALNKTWPRTVSFIATTNSDDFIKETGGMRRYWPVRVGRVDLDALRRDAPLLWGEAVRLYQAGARFWIDKNSPTDARFRATCDREQRGRLTATAYDDLANDLADRLIHGMVMIPDLDMQATERTAFSVTQMQKLLFRDGHAVTAAEWYAAAAALKRRGWSNGPEFRRSGNNKGWGLPQAKCEELRKLHGVGIAQVRQSLKSAKRMPEVVS